MKRKSADRIPKMTYQELVEENMHLKKQIEVFKSEWMPKYVIYLDYLFEIDEFVIDQLVQPLPI
jgi:hypothetical protein